MNALQCPICGGIEFSGENVSTDNTHDLLCQLKCDNCGEPADHHNVIVKE